MVKIKGITLFIFLLALSSIRGWSEERITISVGDQEVLSATGVREVSIGDERIARVVISHAQNKIIVKGRRAGYTSLTLIMADGTTRRVPISVFSRDATQLSSQIQSLLEGVEGIFIQTTGDIVIIDGKIITEKDKRRIDRIVEIFPNVRVLAEFDDIYLMKEDNILIQFSVVELDRSNQYAFGIDWSGILSGFSIEAQWTLEGSAESTAYLIGGGNIPIDLRNVFSKKKVFDTHKVITVVGNRAKYVLGGEIPIQTVSAQGNINVEYKEYGTILYVTPEVDKLGNIRLTIEATVSSIPTATTDYPIISKSEVNSKVRLREGEVVALSGLIGRVNSKALNVIPGLGHIPIIGALLGSRDYQNERSEGVIFITAKKITTGSKENVDLVDGTLKDYQDDSRKWYKR